MRLTSEQIADIVRQERWRWGCAIRVQITAGWGCTVLEIFERDVSGPQVPIRRILL